MIDGKVMIQCRLQTQSLTGNSIRCKALFFYFMDKGCECVIFMGLSSLVKMISLVIACVSYILVYFSDLSQQIQTYLKNFYNYMFCSNTCWNLFLVLS